MTVKANPTGAFLGDSDTQNITGAKTFKHQTLLLRNRADTASLTLQNPVFTGAGETFLYSLADYYVFIDANDSSKVKAIDCHTGKVVSTGTGAGVADVVLGFCTNALTSGSITGGKIYIDSGTYLIGDTDADLYGVKVGGTSTGPNYTVQISGAGRDVTILKNTMTITGNIVFSARAHTIWTDLCFDGDSLGANGAINLLDNRQTANFIQVYRCKFRKHTKHAMFLVNSIPASPSGFIVAHNLFELPAGGWDQFPSETYDTGWGGIIAHNIFDSSKTGSLYAASVTPGASYNLIVEGNIFRGIAAPTGSETIYQGISFEANGNHSNVIIRNNTFEHKNLNIGVDYAWNGLGSGWNPQTGTQTYRNITIEGNVLSDATIRIQGPNDVSYANSIKYVTIQNNTIRSARREGIGARKIADGLVIKNNLIIDSNSRQTASGTEDSWVHPLGLMLVEYCTNAQVTDNYLQMTLSSNNQDPYGISYNNNVNLRMKNNRIINTTANPSTVDGGTNTATVLENIYGDATTTGDLSDALTLNRAGGSSTAETLYTFKVSDDTSSTLKIENGVTTNAAFVPRFNGICGISGQPSLSLYGGITAANDSGSVPVVIIDGRRTTPAALSTRPILDVRNSGTSVFEIKADNGWYHTGYEDHSVISIPADPASTFIRRYAKVIDANNDGSFVKRKINGAVVEVQL